MLGKILNITCFIKVCVYFTYVLFGPTCFLRIETMDKGQEMNGTITRPYLVQSSPTDSRGIRHNYDVLEFAKL